MLVRHGLAVLSGVILGAILGFTFAGYNNADDVQIASIVRDELRGVVNDLPPTRSCDDSQKVQWSGQSIDSYDSGKLGAPGLEAKIDELKTGQEELRESIRDIARQLGQQSEGEQTVVGSYDAQIAASDVETALSNAVSTGSWTEADEQRYYALVQRLAPHERIEALKKLSVAINNGQIRPETAY